MTTICILADTHENEPAMRKAVAIIKQRKPTYVFHLGDIISPPVLENFEGLPMRFLYGNNDGEQEGLKAQCAKRGWEITDTYETTIDNKKLFMAHGHRDDWRIAAKSGNYDYVFYGHTHKKEDKTEHNTRIINPGALFRAQEYTFIFLDLNTEKIEWVTVDKD